MSRARIFIAYAKEDWELRAELERQLAYLEVDGLVEVFFDGLVEPGANWGAVLQEQIRKADIVLFLLSSALIASNYVMNHEVPPAFARHEKGEAVVIPILIRDTGLPAIFADHQYLKSHDGLAVAASSHPDTAWRTVAEGIATKVRIINSRAAAREAGFSTLMLQELKQVLPKRLKASNSVWLCSRTGMGWNRDFPDGIQALVACPEVRFLFLDPEGETFRLDSLLRWKPVDEKGFTTTREGRKSEAEKLYNDLWTKGHAVRVTDVLLPASFWAIESPGSETPASAYIEVPVWKSEHGGNLYIEADGSDRYVKAYRQVFHDLWGQARPWRTEAEAA